MSNYPLALAFLKENPIEAARVLEKLPTADSAAFLQTAPKLNAADVLGKLMPWYAAGCLKEMSPDSTAELLQLLPSHRATNLLRILGSTESKAVLGLLPKSNRRQMRKQMIYPRNTLGAWMESQVPCVPKDATVEESLVLARNLRNQLGQHICVVDREGRFVGGVALAQLIGASNEVRVTELLDPLFVSLPVQATLISVKWHSGWNHNSALPVINVRNEVEGILSTKQLHEGLGDLPDQEMAVGSFISGLVPLYVSCLTLFAHALTAIPYKSAKSEKIANDS